jgi:hypothetical protein
VPLHDLKVGVWCAISVEDNAALSFHETINSKHYVRLILSPFFDELTDEKLYGHFMQDNATAHTVNSSTVALDEVFGK